jgi:hypothetical protein
MSRFRHWTAIVLYLTVGMGGRKEVAQEARATGPSAATTSDQKLARLGVSIFELLARPDDYSGQIVAVTGYLKIDVEEQLLYASEEFAKAGIIENALAVEAMGCMNGDESREILTRLEGARNSYTRIRGRFMKANPSRYPYQSGRLCSIHDIKERVARAHN